MNSIEELETEFPQYTFIPDPFLPTGLPALNINEEIRYNPNIAIEVIRSKLYEEVGHGETTGHHDITKQRNPTEWKEERKARDWGLLHMIPVMKFVDTLRTDYESDWQAAEELGIDLYTLHERKALYDIRGK